MMTPYYSHAGIEIYHGDCREILPGLPRVDAVITDPPYGIGFGAKHTKWSANRGVVLGTWDAAVPDVSWLLDVADHIAIWGGERFQLPVRRGWLTWVKPDAAPTFASTEYAWTNRDKPARHIVFSVGEMNQERLGHPTQKPEAVMLWTIQQVAPHAHTILDPFMGSGTTLVAAKNLGRKAIGIEIEEKYCEIAAKRLSQEVFEFPAQSMMPQQEAFA
jgi:DNA modification methylase